MAGLSGQVVRRAGSRSAGTRTTASLRQTVRGIACVRGFSHAGASSFLRRRAVDVIDSSAALATRLSPAELPYRPTDPPHAAPPHVALGQRGGMYLMRPRFRIFLRENAARLAVSVASAAPRVMEQRSAPTRNSRLRHESFGTAPSPSSPLLSRSGRLPRLRDGVMARR